MTLMFRESIYSSLVAVEDNPLDGCLKMLLAMQDGLWTTSEMKKSAISKNKAAFKIYVESFDEGHEVVAMKRRRRENKEAKIKEASLNSSPRKAASPLATAVLSGHLSTEKYVSRVISSGSAEKFKPTIPTRKRVRKSASSVTELPVASTSTENNTVTADDEELLAITVEFEKSLGKQMETVVMLFKIIALSFV